MFTHLNKLGDFELEANTIDGVRYYTLPSGKKAPSITSITSFYNRQTFINWRKKVGEEEANKITKVATTRGTKFHDLVEQYLLNKDINTLDVLPTTKALFLHGKKYLDNINNIHALEKPLYSEYFGIAGRVDCIAEYNGKLSVIDFKTANKERNDEWNKNYYIQTAAYAFMYEELFGTPIEQIVIIMASEDGAGRVFIKNKSDYLSHLEEAIKYFYKYYQDKIKQK